jgi:hypothetical protein
MTMISRRALFGIGAGAATAAIAPQPAKAEVIVGMDFGKEPATLIQIASKPGRTKEWLRDNLHRIQTDPEYARYKDLLK